ncbi:voltage-gated ion channel superfamily, partial [Micromonas pusilla CCMP1545]
METIPWFYEDDAGYDHWFAIETVCIVFFTAELGGRIWSARDRKKFSKKFLNWVDLVAILPYYIELFSRGGAEVPGLAVLRAIRLARVFRLMKVSKRSLKMLGTTMVKSGKSLNVLFFLLLISLVVFSALMYFAERGNACVAVTEESPFQSIPHSMWFSAVTMATLGYGDVYPVTGWGFLVAAVQMLYGILVVAMPVTVVGSNFTQIYN